MNVGLLRVLAVFLLSLPMARVPEEGSQVEIPPISRPSRCGSGRSKSGCSSTGECGRT